MKIQKLQRNDLMMRLLGIHFSTSPGGTSVAGRIRRATRRALFIATAFFAAFTLPAAPCKADLSEDIAKELDYVESMVVSGTTAGDTDILRQAHRVLSNLEINAAALPDAQYRARVNLAMGYFYVRMSETLLLAQVSNPAATGTVDCARQAEHFFNASLDIVSTLAVPSAVADTHFFIGAGYDALRARIATVPGGNTAPAYTAAMAHLQKAVAGGTSFDGARAVLRKLQSIKPADRESAVAPEEFLQMHRTLYMEKSFPRPATAPPASISKDKSPDKAHTSDKSTGASSASPPRSDEPNTFVNYKWRFSIKRPDDSWTFYATEMEKGFHLLIQKAPGQRPLGSGVNVICHALTPAERALPLKGLVQKSLQILTSAGYKLDNENDTDFKGTPAVELTLSNRYNDIESAATLPMVASKQYMIILTANGIEYILSFNSLASEYDSVFPMLKVVTNTLTLF